MPKALEQQLMRQARSQGLSGDQRDAYVYGTMRDTGWKPKQERKKRQTETMVSALRDRAAKKDAHQKFFEE